MLGKFQELAKEIPSLWVNRELEPVVEPMNVAIVGCGYVADLYMRNFVLHPELQLSGVYDRIIERRDNFSNFHSVGIYPSLEEILNDPKVDIVLNLTNPSSHYEVSKAALQAHKHVYSEKPLAMSYEQAEELVSFAKTQGLEIVAAPCNVLSESAQTLWKALREEKIGRVRAVYAEMDDGMVHRMAFQRWVSESGIPWPYKDEFEVGCTLEHAGYYLGWLLAFFGPVTTMTSFSETVVEDKLANEVLDVNAADFSVACLKFASGVVARLTCSIIAEHDHELKIYGDRGVLFTEDCWRYRSPVYIKKRITIRRKTLVTPWKTKVSLQGKALPLNARQGPAQMDFCRGLGEMVKAIRVGRKPRLSSEFSLHVTELALAIQNAGNEQAVYKPRSTFEPMEPMPWAT
ncbi:MAG: Gfo/Idh/MocA family oxidoreductase [Myxococcales bacterium]|nr:Gfo/Idh/MocA family oxidoreductase [Myxococcales bacterium]